MKRTLCILLTLILAALCIPAVHAQTTEDKISPELRALIDAHPEGGIENGVVVEIFHHNPSYPTDGISEETASVIQDNPKHSLTDAEKLAVENNLKAHAELIGQIAELTYMEPDGFSIGRCYIGLPYDAIEQVAALENIDYIDLPRDGGSTRTPEDKYHEVMQEALRSYSPAAAVRLTLRLAYTARPYVGMPEPGIDSTAEEINAYILADSAARKAYYTAKNNEYAAVIAAQAAVKVTEIFDANNYITVETQLGELDRIVQMKEVDYVGFGGVIHDPHAAEYVFAEKVEQWIYEKKGSVKWEPERPMTDPDYWEFTYSDYNELYACDEWALVFATVNANDPWEKIGHVCIGTRVVSWWEPGAAIYPYGYFVYSVREDTFYPIDRFTNPVVGSAQDENGADIPVILEPAISLDDYPGILGVLDELEIGVMRGDADGDGRVTVLDATRMQRYRASLIAETGLDLAASDADSDGKVTVLDATRVQRTIAKICTIDGTPTGENPTDDE